MAAKISAARALARKLSEEKQAAMSAARLAAEQAMNEEEIDRCNMSLHHTTVSPAQRVHAAVLLVRNRQVRPHMEMPFCRPAMPACHLQTLC